MSWRTANHSFQLYAAHTGDLAYKTQWNNDNYSGWLTPVVYGRNGGSSSGKTIYADRFYDTNDTSYYSDPRSTSYFNDMRANIYYDRGNPGYYGVFDSTSRMNRVDMNDGRADIFYDRTDTGYYMNLNSTSYVYEFRSRWRQLFGIQSYDATLYDGNANYRPGTTIRGQYPHIDLVSSNINNSNHGPTLRFVAYDSGGATSGNFKHWVIGTAGTNATMLSFGYSPNQTNPHYGIGRGWSSGNNIAMMWMQTDRHVYAENDFRAQVFRDRNDSNYYGDFNGSSRMNYVHMNELRVDGGGHSHIVVDGNGGSGYYQSVHIGESGKGAAALHLTYRGDGYSWIGMGEGNQRVPQYWSMEMYYQRADVYFNSRGTARNDFRAPIFYDSNATEYYMDPNSSSVINNLTTRGTLTAYNITTNQIKFRQSGSGSNNTDPYLMRYVTPSYNTSWLEFQLNDDASEEFRIYGYSCSGYGCGEYSSNLYHRFRADGYTYHNGYMEVTSSVRSPIFYNYTDTSYYVDPNSTTQLHYVLANNWFRPQGATGLYFESYGYGLWAVGAQGGEYGNVSTYGGGVNGWEGWSITGRSVFMHDGGTATGIYNDVNNEWMLYGIFNSYMELRYNNSRKGRAESWGWRVDGDMRATGDVIAYYSDMRLKDKVGDIESALDKVGKLNGFYYRNNKEANLIGYEGNDLQVGLSAQDVESVLPEIVHPAPLAQALGYDYKTINYDRVVPLLVNAINEQKEIVDEQKEEIEYLKSELSEMKEMLKQLLNKE
jgi:hypothetical protein